MDGPFPFAGQLVRSVVNRARPLAMLARGAATRVFLPGLVTGGKGLCIGRSVDLVVYGQLIVGENVTLSDGCAIEVGPSGRLILGDRAFIGRHSVIVTQARIDIGSDTLVAEHCSIRDQSHHLDPDQRRQEVEAQAERRALERGIETAPIVIGSNVWIGAGVRVLKGSRIGDRTVIGANAVVRDELPADVVAAGIPARVLRRVDQRPNDPT